MSTVIERRETVQISDLMRIDYASIDWMLGHVLPVAIEKGVFTVLGDGPLAQEELRGRLGFHGRGFESFLTILVAKKYLVEVGGCFQNAPISTLYLDSRSPLYVGGFLEMLAGRLGDVWRRLPEALTTGRSLNGPDMFQLLLKDRIAFGNFLRAMTGHSMVISQSLARKFPWEKYRTFADIGSAEGAAIAAALRAHPHLTATGFDLPEVGPYFREYVERHGVGSRVRFLPGNFWEDELPWVDVILMSRIIHDWPELQKAILMRKAFEALRRGGIFIVCEMLIDAGSKAARLAAAAMDLNMLLEIGGGEASRRAYVGWMRAVGFVNVRVRHLAGPYYMIIGVKP